jgi:hypothetical protein
MSFFINIKVKVLKLKAILQNIIKFMMTLKYLMKNKKCSQ